MSFINYQNKVKTDQGWITWITTFKQTFVKKDAKAEIRINYFVFLAVMNTKLNTNLPIDLWFEKTYKTRWRHKLRIL